MPENILQEIEVVGIKKETPISVNGVNQTYQELEVKNIGSDNLEATPGATYVLKNGDLPMTKQNIYQLGDKLMVNVGKPNNLETYQITDYVRHDQLFLLGIIFLIVTLVVARKQGLLAIISLVFTFGVIFKILLPMIMAGHNPFLAAILSLILIIPVTFYLTHGFQKKTHAAVIATFLSLVFTIALAQLAVSGVHLTGYASEEAGFVFAQVGDQINIRGLLLAGMVLATLGVINDVTVAQASVVSELKKANPKQTFGELYKKSMQVGRDHITSMVDTLVLTYAGASLPLLLLIGFGNQPLMQTLNYEVIAEEIVRTLVGSLGLVVAVPLTTLISCMFEEN
jgi:uncharacterized membrane protein